MTRKRILVIILGILLVLALIFVFWKIGKDYGREQAMYDAGREVMTNCLNYFCGENDILCNITELRSNGELCNQILFNEISSTNS
jgi:hypothetical protein